MDAKLREKDEEIMRLKQKLQQLGDWYPLLIVFLVFSFPFFSSRRHEKVFMMARHNMNGRTRVCTKFLFYVGTIQFYKKKSHCVHVETHKKKKKKKRSPRPRQHHTFFLPFFFFW
jgi:hypothetical protein